VNEIGWPEKCKDSAYVQWLDLHVCRPTCTCQKLWRWRVEKHTGL